VGARAWVRSLEEQQAAWLEALRWVEGEEGGRRRVSVEKWGEGGTGREGGREGGRQGGREAGSQGLHTAAGQPAHSSLTSHAECECTAGCTAE
jgi:hypothetical protein